MPRVFTINKANVAVETRPYSHALTKRWKEDAVQLQPHCMCAAPEHVCSACVRYPFPTFQPWKVCVCWEIPRENYCSGWKKKIAPQYQKRHFRGNLAQQGPFSSSYFSPDLIQNPLGHSPLSWLSSEYRPETCQPDALSTLLLFWLFLESTGQNTGIYSNASKSTHHSSLNWITRPCLAGLIPNENLSSLILWYNGHV